MKISKYLLFTAILGFALTSCNKDDDSSDDTTPTSPNYEFKNQNLQGQIGGNAWEFSSGSADKGFFGATDTLSADFSNKLIPDPCAVFITGNKLIGNIPLTVGIHELNLNASLFSGYTFTIYDTVDNINYIATKGAVEVLTISETEITGQMDIRYDNENFVNGKFSIERCDQ